MDGADKGLYKQEADHRIVAVLKGQYVNDIAFAGESLFVGTSNGVWQLSHALPDKKRQLLEGWNVQTLFCDKPKKELWIGTFGSGLSVMNPRHFQSACAGGTRKHVPSSDTGNYRL